jgi:flagellin
MSSILTNTSAMTALQTLKTINSDLAKTQDMISTGKKVATAKDNAAIWAISKAMDSDVKGFNAVSESLSLGESTVAVARNAAETVTDLLTEMKGKIVAAQEENVDRASIQTDIDALEAQISSVVSAAQFNGLNLVDGSSTDPMQILSSLNRDANGNVTDAQIEVGRQDLSVTGPVTSGTFGTADPANAAAAAAMISSTAGTTIEDDTVYDGTNNDDSVTSGGGTTTWTIGEVSEGHSYQIILDDVTVNVAGGGTTTGQRTFEYIATATDGTADVANALANQIGAFFGAATNGDYTIAQGTGANTNQFTITNNSGTDILSFTRAQTGGTPGPSSASGGLAAVQDIDVTTDSGATGALATIDGLINQATDAAASFGSAQRQIETQSDFVSNLTDSLKAGIGALVDANMEEASARLQALQVQQQLGVQALSIANQAPQTILALFR